MPIWSLEIMYSMCLVGIYYGFLSVYALLCHVFIILLYVDKCVDLSLDGALSGSVVLFAD